MKNEKVYRNSMNPVGNTGGLQVRATSLNLLPVLRTDVARGNWLNEGTAPEPVAVLGESLSCKGSGYVADTERAAVCGQIRVWPVAPIFISKACKAYCCVTMSGYPLWTVADSVPGRGSLGVEVVYQRRRPAIWPSTGLRAL